MGFFIHQGLEDYQAAGIVGNLLHECPGLDPATVQYGGGPGFGLAQWERGRDRYKSLEKFAQKHSSSVHNFSTQARFLWYELNHYSYFGLAKLEETTDVNKATFVFMRWFERPNPDSCNLAQRKALGRRVLAWHESGYRDEVRRPTLRQGASGPPVRHLQQLLLRLGLGTGRNGADGQFGPATMQAVKRFQHANGLQPDGIVGRATWAALLEE